MALTGCPNSNNITMSDKKVSVTALKPFRDKEKGSNWVGTGHVWQVSEERAKELEEKGLVAVGEEGTEKVQITNRKEKRTITKP